MGHKAGGGLRAWPGVWGSPWLRALVKGGGKGKGAGSRWGSNRTASWSLPADPGSRGGSWIHRPAQPKPGPHTPCARPAPGTPQPCPRPSAAPRAEGLCEVPVAQPAPEGPAPGGVCGVDTSGGCFNTAGLGPLHPLHPPGALSLQRGSVHSGLRPPPGSVPLSIQATPPTPPPPQPH